MRKTLLAGAAILALSTGAASAFPWHEGCEHYSVTTSPQANVRPVPTLNSDPLWTIHSVDWGSPQGSILYCGQYFENLVEGITWMWVSFYFPVGYDGGEDHEGWMAKSTLTPYYPPVPRFPMAMPPQDIPGAQYAPPVNDWGGE